MIRVNAKITAALLRKYANQENVIICDIEIVGFQARVGKKGVTLYLRKRQNKKLYEKTIGRWPDVNLEDARRDAIKLVASIVNFEVPDPVAASKQPTLGEAIDHFVARVKNTANAKSILSYLYPLRNKKIIELSRNDIIAAIEPLKDKKTTSNRLLTYLKSAISGLAKSLDMELPNPAANIPYFILEPRRRFLSETEAPRLMDALQKLSSSALNGIQAQALLMMIYTGQRKSNVLQMNLSEIDERGVWTVPQNKSKSGRDIVVPLNQFAMEIVRKLTPSATNGFLFCWRGKPMKEVRKTMSAACRMAGVEDCHVHDLRRTLGSWMLMNGTPIEVVSRTLGHSSISITEQVYAHLLPHKISDATEAAVGAMLKGKV